MLNVGWVLNWESRGWGVGKAVIRGLIGIGLETGLGSVSVSTIKANKGMRGLVR